MFILDQYSIKCNDVSNQHKATEHQVLGYTTRQWLEFRGRRF